MASWSGPRIPARREHDRRGPVPIASDAPASSVEVLDVDPATVDLREPFFHMTVQRLLVEGHRPRTIGIDALVSATATATSPRPPPLAFVVHTGRCGSTLLMNLLAAHPDVMAFHEPEPVLPLLDGSARLLLAGEAGRAVGRRRAGSGSRKAMTSGWPGGPQRGAAAAVCTTKASGRPRARGRGRGGDRAPVDADRPRQVALHEQPLGGV